MWLASVSITAVLSAASYYLVELPLGKLRWMTKRHAIAVFIISTALPALLAGSCTLNALDHSSSAAAGAGAFEFDLADNLNRTYFDEPDYPWLVNNTQDRTTLALRQNLDRVSWPFFDSEGWGTPATT